MINSLTRNNHLPYLHCIACLHLHGINPLRKIFCIDYCFISQGSGAVNYFPGYISDGDYLFFIAVCFLGAFIWLVKSGQYEDRYTPSVRILFDEDKKKKS